MLVCSMDKQNFCFYLLDITQGIRREGKKLFSSRGSILPSASVHFVVERFFWFRSLKVETFTQNRRASATTDMREKAKARLRELCPRD